MNALTALTVRRIWVSAGEPFRDQAVEAFRLLQIRQVARVSQNLHLGVGDALEQQACVGYRGDGVLLADQDERGAGYRGQIAGRVGARAQPARRGGQPDR